MDFTWTDLLPLLHGIDSRSVFEACADAILSELQTIDLPNIIHTLICDYAIVEDTKTRIVTASLIELIISKYASSLSRLLAESESEGVLLGFQSLDIRIIVDCKYCLGKGTDAGNKMDNNVDKDLYSKNWQEKQKKRLKRILEGATESVTASLAMMHNDDSLSDELISGSVLEERKETKEVNKLDLSSFVESTFQNMTTVKHVEDQLTCETWFARIIRHLLVTMTDERWYCRDGASRSLCAILKSLPSLPYFIVDDGLCLGLLVLVIDRFFDFKDLVKDDDSPIMMLSLWPEIASNVVSTMPVKSSMALLVGHCLKSLSEDVLMHHIKKVVQCVDELLMANDWTVQYGGVQLMVSLAGLFPHCMFSSDQEAEVLFNSFLKSLRVSVLSEMSELSELSLQLLHIFQDHFSTNIKSVPESLVAVINDIVENITQVNHMDAESEGVSLEVLASLLQIVVLAKQNSNDVQNMLICASSIFVATLVLLQKKSEYTTNDNLVILKIMEALLLEDDFLVVGKTEDSFTDSILTSAVGIIVVMVSRIDNIRQKGLVDETIDEDVIDEMPLHKRIRAVLLENIPICDSVAEGWVAVSIVLSKIAKGFIKIVDRLIALPSDKDRFLNDLLQVFGLICLHDSSWKNLSIGSIPLSRILSDLPVISSHCYVAFRGLWIYHFLVSVSARSVKMLREALFVAIQDKIQAELMKITDNTGFGSNNSVSKKGVKRKILMTGLDSSSSKEQEFSVESAALLMRWILISYKISENDDLRENHCSAIFSSLKELSNLKLSAKRVTRKASLQVDILESLQVMNATHMSRILCCGENFDLALSWYSVRCFTLISCHQYVSEIMSGLMEVDKIIHHFSDQWKELLSKESIKFRSLAVEDSLVLTILRSISTSVAANHGALMLKPILNVASCAAKDVHSILVVATLIHRWSIIYYEDEQLERSSSALKNNNIDCIILIFDFIALFTQNIELDHETSSIIEWLVTKSIGNICNKSPATVESLGKIFESKLFENRYPAVSDLIAPAGPGFKRSFISSIYQSCCKLISSMIALSGFDLWINIAIFGIADHEASVRSSCMKAFRSLVPLAPLAIKTIDKVTDREVESKKATTVLMEELLSKSRNFSLMSSSSPRDIALLEAFYSLCPQFGSTGNIRIREYQWEAISWWTTLRRCGLNGVLADDMGLGKTLQSLLSLLLLRLERKLHIHSPTDSSSLPLQPSVSLIICPSALVYHWDAEIANYFSDCDLLKDTYVCNGMNWRSEVDDLKPSLLVVSYDVLKRNVDFFTSKAWEMIILDEAHLIRNPKTMLSKSIFQLKSQHRLALTGTPIQNKIEDMWSLMHFLLPDYLGNFQTFSKTYIAPVKKSMMAFRSMKMLVGNDNDSSVKDFKKRAKASAAGLHQLKQLHKLVLPFIMRRKKEDVLRELPPKTIIDLVCPLTNVQKSMYDSFMQKISASMSEEKLIAGLVNEYQAAIKNINSNAVVDEQNDALNIDLEGVQLFENVTTVKAPFGMGHKKPSLLLKSNPFSSNASSVPSGPVINHLTVLNSLQLLCAHPALVVDRAMHAHYRDELVSNVGSSGKFRELMKLLVDVQIVDPEMFEDSEHQFTDISRFYESLNGGDLDSIPQPTVEKDEEVDESSYRVKKNQSSAESDSESETNPNDSLSAAIQDSSTFSISKKCLIFAKHQSTLDLLEECVFKRFFPTLRYARLDGSMSPESRFRISQQFQQGNYLTAECTKHASTASDVDEDSTVAILKATLPHAAIQCPQEKARETENPIQVLLLTTRSSGLGLNLSAADTVIFLENDWNPFVDLQAMDRAHRLGQKNAVMVYRLLADSTIESRIMTLQYFKQSVANEVIHGEDNEASPAVSQLNQNNLDNPGTNVGRQVWDSLVKRCVA